MLECILCPFAFIGLQCFEDLDDRILLENFQDLAKLEAWESHVIEFALFYQALLEQYIERFLMSHSKVVVNVPAWLL